MSESVVDKLCSLITDAQDKYWNSPCFNPTTDSSLRVSLVMQAEIAGMRTALAVVMELPPEEGEHEGEAASFQLEWREKNGRNG